MNAAATWWGLTAAALTLTGYGWYIHDTIRSSTEPERVTWLVFAAEYAVLFAAQAACHAGPGLWLPGSQLAGTTIVLAAALRHGTGGITPTRAALLAGVAAGLILWWAASPGWALLIILAVEGWGMGLTIAKTWRAPATETPAMWVLCALAGACDAPALGWHAARILYIYPVFFSTLGTLEVAAWRFGRRDQRTSQGEQRNATAA